MTKREEMLKMDAINERVRRVVAELTGHAFEVLNREWKEANREAQLEEGEKSKEELTEFLVCTSAVAAFTQALARDKGMPTEARVHAVTTAALLGEATYVQAQREHMQEAAKEAADAALFRIMATMKAGEA